MEDNNQLKEKQSNQKVNSDYIKILLHKQDLSNLVELLGQLPTETNIWPLYIKLLNELNEEDEYEAFRIQ